MIKIEHQEPQTPSWKKWRLSAEKATLKLIGAAAGGKFLKISGAMYKHQKKELFSLFHNKCAYCEADLGSQHGDIEHYRPKKKVTDIENEEVKILDVTGSRPHPGYYWLAYDWRNLVPACVICNQQPTLRPDGKLAGKGNRFPISSKRATSSTDPLPNEDAILLHPVLDDPQEHLTLDGSTGVLGFKTKRGELTIEILGLNRDWLIEQRKCAYNQVFANLMTALPFIFKQQRGLASQEIEYIKRHKKGSAPFALAGRKAIEFARLETGIEL